MGILKIPQTQASAILAVLCAYVLVLTLGAYWMRILVRPDVILVADLLGVTTLLVISGTLGSPFLYLYYLVILEAAVRLNLRQAFTASTAAAATIVFLGVRANGFNGLEAVGFRIGAFMAGGFMLALILSVVVEEHRAGQERIRWNALLDQRLREATAQLKEQLTELQFYNTLASRLSGELHVKGVLEILLGAFSDATGLPRGLAYGVGEDNGLHLLAARGFGTSAEGGVPDSVPPLALPQEANGHEVLTIARVPSAEAPESSAVCVPLVRAGKLRGWLCGLCDAGLPLPEPARRRLLGMTAQGVSALEAARLYEEVQRMIKADPTRSLYPWAGLERLLTEEIERCKTLNLIFSLLEIRLEGYRAESHEHAGDQDLAFRRVVKLLQDPLRRIDVLSHDGADRFAVVLPRITKTQAVATAQAIVDRLEEDSVTARLFAGQSLRIAAAVVTYPLDGASAADLMVRVEALLATEPATRPRV